MCVWVCGYCVKEKVCQCIFVLHISTCGEFVLYKSCIFIYPYMYICTCMYMTLCDCLVQC